MKNRYIGRKGHYMALTPFVSLEKLEKDREFQYNRVGIIGYTVRL